MHHPPHQKRPMMIHHSRNCLLLSETFLNNTGGGGGVAFFAEARTAVCVEPAWLLDLSSEPLLIIKHPFWSSGWKLTVILNTGGGSMGENLFSLRQTYFPSEKEWDHLFIHPSIRLTTLTRNYSLHSFLSLILRPATKCLSWALHNSIPLLNKQNALSFFIIKPASLFLYSSSPSSDQHGKIWASPLQTFFFFSFFWQSMGCLFRASLPNVRFSVSASS